MLDQHSGAPKMSRNTYLPPSQLLSLSLVAKLTSSIFLFQFNGQGQGSGGGSSYLRVKSNRELSACTNKFIIKNKLFLQNDKTENTLQGRECRCPVRCSSWSRLQKSKLNWLQQVVLARTISVTRFSKIFVPGVHPEFEFSSIDISELSSIFKALLKGAVPCVKPGKLNTKTLAGKRVHHNGSVGSSFDPPLFSVDNSFKPRKTEIAMLKGT